jgi:predicted pyridoxine 5'-phosphate oxidase superfamily flavin-nucleotide-binding protein
LATIKDEWRDPINSALADGAACLVGTVSEDGQPQISPKGSVLVHDASTLAYWERSFRTASANIKSNAKIVIYFRNPGKAEVLPQGATLRFYGTARVVESGPVREAVMSKVVKRERVAVLVDIKRITDLRGNDVS